MKPNNILCKYRRGIANGCVDKCKLINSVDIFLVSLDKIGKQVRL